MTARPGSRRRALALLALLGCAVSPAAVAQKADKLLVPPVTLSQLVDFRRDAVQAARQCMPIVIMLAQDGCPYCRTLRDEIFKPMIRSGDYRDSAILRELSLDPGSTLIDERGTRIDAGGFARRNGSNGLTPTVVFLGPDGNSVATPIVGISNIDYYGFYLDRAIERARERMAASCDSSPSAQVVEPVRSAS